MSRASVALRRSGYTLVEMVVVMAIIFILASLIGVAARAGLRQSKVSSCVANLKSIYSALRLYEVDHGQDPPFLTQMMAPGRDYTEQLTNSLATDDVWRCPLDGDFGKDRPTHDGNHLHSSYGHTGDVLAHVTTREDGTISFNLGAVPEASNFRYLVDLLTIVIDASGNPSGNSAHGNSVNTLYGDGHIEHKPIVVRRG